MQLVDVIEAKRHHNLAGLPRWRLTLACGHEREIAASKGRRAVRVPKRVKCYECEAGGHHEARQASGKAVSHGTEL